MLALKRIASSEFVSLNSGCADRFHAQASMIFNSMLCDRLPLDGTRRHR
jgi:hypothetical protein